MDKDIYNILINIDNRHCCRSSLNRLLSLSKYRFNTIFRFFRQVVRQAHQPLKERKLLLYLSEIFS
jgi:hypothetical protein